MKNKIETTYGRTLQGLMFAVNPVKKVVLKTHCTVHKYINMRSIDILKNENQVEQYKFYREHIKPLNLGVTWADQDLKSSNHFFHAEKSRGLYGFSDALTEFIKYYKKAVTLLKNGELEKAVFYFGAACHLVQDVTVPHHVSNKLLKSHRRFELWIIARLMSDYSFEAEYGIKRYDALDEYIINNAKMATRAHEKYEVIYELEERFKKLTTEIIHEAQRTTAGLMLDFYDEVIKYKR
ncbi:zinc dependent phospholipase C family protein [Clostridium thermarum]|uniref:zinc dependent phospholipase C family protein n=1 Tax=Clostridium thermarum TaxID=1716543 RepID=UPI0013D4DB91|nr:zinc dependent phospholipase C family protein [Clostridium thermarum]